MQLLLLALLLAGCNTKTEPTNFNLVFAMESANNYKVSLEINSDKKFSIKQQNLYFDSFAGEERINTVQGELTGDEFAELMKMLTNTPLLKMKETYGFDKRTSPNDPFIGLVYYLTYTEGSKTKYIAVQPNASNKYPGKFPQLIKFLSNYSSHQLKKEEI